MLYDNLVRHSSRKGIEILEEPMKGSIRGLYSDNVIWINRNLQTSADKVCVLAEELGHHYTTSGDIIDQSVITNRKHELRARNWAYEYLVPLSAFVQAHKTGIRNRHELADFLNITEEFLADAIKRYQEKYGIYKQVDKYTVCFEPLGVMEWFDWEE